jgi:peptide/nickel transport system ATP-binding protein/oligopeptide transport system ATP-binding protein
MELLSAKDITKDYAVESGIFRQRTGTVHALDGVSLCLEKGKTLGVLGESGSGKTTLGRILCGLLRPDRGEVRIDGRSLVEYSRVERAGKIQMIFQDPFASLNPRLNIGAILSEAAGDIPLRERDFARSSGFL